MSAVGAAFARAVASLGGPQVAAAVVAGGIVVGALGGVVASGGSSGLPGAPAGELAVYPCPDQGPALLTVKGGQKLLATGRTEDGTWLRIHFPAPGRTEAWVQAAPLQVTGQLMSLPVAACAPEVALAPPDVLPGPSLTVTVNNSPSPGPTPEPTATPAPTPSPTPTPSPSVTAAPNAKPVLTALTVSTKTISYDTGAYCPTAVKKVTFKVKATDASGVTGVVLFWRAPGSASYAQAPMARSAGTATSGTWQVTLDTTANGIKKAGKLTFYAVGTDTDGATGRIPATGANSITVAVCLNTGPSITNVASSAGTTLYWTPPTGASCTPTRTNITATVKDVDGVASVSLFWRAPGTTTDTESVMTRTTGTALSGTWRATLDTGQMATRTQSTGTLSWYIKAVDTKNKASQTKAASMTIRICDTTAPMSGQLGYDSQTMSVSTSVVAVCRPRTINFSLKPADPESGITKVVLYWTTLGTNTVSWRTMTRNGDFWATTLNAASDGIAIGSYYPVYAVVTNGAGLTAQTASMRFFVVSCI